MGGPPPLIQFLSAEASFSRRERFHSVDGFYWYRRLRGCEAELFTRDRQIFENSVQLSYPISPEQGLLGILNKLCNKAIAWMRQRGFAFRTVQLTLRYGDGTFYRDHRTLDQRAVTKVCIDLYNLIEAACPKGLFPDGAAALDRRLMEAMAAVNGRYGLAAGFSGRPR